MNLGVRKEKNMASIVTRFPRKKYELEVGGRTLSVETGRFAQQANGSVFVRYGDTVVLATAVISAHPRVGASFFPLMVDYNEKLYAAGKIKGSRFIKREGRPSDEAVLTARLIDRSIRPLFPQHITNEIQVIVDVLSFDGVNDPDVLSIIAVSTALSISDIPFGPTLSAIRVGRVGGEFVLNTPSEKKKESDLDLVLSVAEGKVIMIEAGAKEVREEDFLAAIEFGKKYVAPITEFVKKITAEIGMKKLSMPAPELPAEVRAEVERMVSEKIETILFSEPKLTRKKEVSALGDEISASLSEKHGEELAQLIVEAYQAMVERFISDKIVKEGKRIGGRALTEIRPLEIDCGVLPRTHGSGYFSRGETQVITTATLGSPSDAQIIDDMELEYKKRFMHHYNFPPYSVGEVKPVRGPSRRDIGHGALAERALEPVMPDSEKFPYTIRLVSEVLGSNGSSSMASVCGSTLAMMDAGIPITRPVAGIAMGLASNDKGDWKVLTDLQDLEDSEGGMDFKIAGTREGITGVQLDTKTHGLLPEMVTTTVNQARTARLELLDAMGKVIAEPRKELSQYAPRILSFFINPDKIRDVIGPGGKIINKIIDETGVEIDIEDSGLVMVSAVDPKALQKAVDWIKDLTREAQVGEVYTGPVVKVMDFGAFVEIFPGTEGMIHVSKMGQRVRTASDLLHPDDMVVVKVIEIDRLGRINLSLESIKK